MAVVVLTGAPAGVGRTTAVAFARRGDAGALVARGRLDAAAKQVGVADGTSTVLPLDVADPAAVGAAADAVEAELGPIDTWVNNAMVSVFSPVAALTAKEVRRVTEVTYLGYVHGTVAPFRLIDRYLARKGYPTRQADEPVEPHRPDNLFDLRPGHHGVHGRFDDCARASIQVLAARLAAGTVWSCLARRGRNAA